MNRKRYPGMLIMLGIAVLIGGSLLGGAVQASPVGYTRPISAPVRPVEATTTPGPCPTWSVVPSPNQGTRYNYLYGVAARVTNDIWAAGYYLNGDTYQTLIEHWDGSSWSIVPSPNQGTGYNNLYGVAAVAANDVWAVGTYMNNATTTQTLIEHWNGSSWSIVPSPNQGTRHNLLLGVAAVAANDVWAAGYYYNGTMDQTLIEHWNGSSWSIVPSPNQASRSVLFAVSAVAANDVWTVGSYRNGTGGQALVEHWNGSSWSIVPGPRLGTQSHSFWGVTAVATNNVWAVGAYWDTVTGPYSTLTAHWNGTAWSAVSSPSPGTNGNQLLGVAAPASDDVWAVGYARNDTEYQTLIEHWNGSSWSVMPSPNPGTVDSFLRSVAAVAANDLWTAGDNLGQTLIEHYTDSCVPPGPTPTSTPSPSPTPCVPGQFSDVHTSDYFYTPVSYLVSHGVISGYSDCTYRPYNETTRAQMVKIVVLGFQHPVAGPPSGSYMFADVPPSFPFYSVIETAAARQIVSGYTCGGVGEPCDGQQRPYFRPYANVTRGQLSKIVVGAAGWALAQPPNGSFADVVPGSTFYGFVETAGAHGVISGYACGGVEEPCDGQRRPYFRQIANATRGQIAKIVYLAVTSGPQAGTRGGTR